MKQSVTVQMSCLHLIPCVWTSLSSWSVCVCVLSGFSHVRLCATPWTAAPHTRLLCPWGFSSQEYWNGCCALLQGVFPTQGSNPRLLCLLLKDSSKRDLCETLTGRQKAGSSVSPMLALKLKFIF